MIADSEDGFFARCKERVVLRWFDLSGKVSEWFWILKEKCRKRIRPLRELDAFRGLVILEPQLAEWPRAVPLLERALVLYETTHQTRKRDVILKRLAEIEAGRAHDRLVRATCETATEVVFDGGEFEMHRRAEGSEGTFGEAEPEGRAMRVREGGGELAAPSVGETVIYLFTETSPMHRRNLFRRGPG